jgi:carbon storage regulator
MLVLTRKTGERILIDGCIVIEVLAAEGNRVRIGIRAPRDVPIRRPDADAATAAAADDDDETRERDDAASGR